MTSLKVTVESLPRLHPCDPFLINSRNMTGNSVEKKNCFAVLKLKLQLKLRFKMLYLLLKLLHAAFALNTTTKMACFA